MTVTSYNIETPIYQTKERRISSVDSVPIGTPFLLGKCNCIVQIYGCSTVFFIPSITQQLNY